MPGFGLRGKECAIGHGRSPWFGLLRRADPVLPLSPEEPRRPVRVIPTAHRRRRLRLTPPSPQSPPVALITHVAAFSCACGLGAPGEALPTAEGMRSLRDRPALSGAVSGRASRGQTASWLPEAAARAFAPPLDPARGARARRGSGRGAERPPREQGVSGVCGTTRRARREAPWVAGGSGERPSGPAEGLPRTAAPGRAGPGRSPGERRLISSCAGRPVSRLSE